MESTPVSFAGLYRPFSLLDFVFPMQLRVRFLGGLNLEQTRQVKKVHCGPFEVRNGPFSLDEFVKRWLNRVMRDHEAHASAINRK